MARFEVTISEMQNSANKISQAAEAFLDAAEAVMAGANDLASEWEGDSQVAFVAEQEKANQWYKKMVDIAAKTYQEADEASAANIKSH